MNRIEIPHLLVAMEQAIDEHETYLNERIVKDIWERYDLLPKGHARGDPHPAAGTVGAWEIAEVIASGQTRHAAFDEYMERLGWHDLSDARDYSEWSRACHDFGEDFPVIEHLQAAGHLHQKVIGALCRARRQGLVDRGEWGWTITVDGDALLHGMELVA